MSADMQPDMLILVDHAHLILDGIIDSNEFCAHIWHPKSDAAADQA